MRRNKGITLIALVITIIILLILAGVTIAKLTESGLFEKAKLAKEQAEQAELDEQEKLQDYIDMINGKELPANTPETDAGTEVKLEEGWGTQTVKYIKTSDGTEVKELETVATVYAISVGNGETVPVPYGFYYVGGDLDSGVVISDDMDDKNKYAGKTAVGIDLEGNQFVWIPCEANNYKKTDYEQANCNWDSTVSTSELLQIEKYGGYYVARYESGLDLSKAHTSETLNSSNLHDSETSKVQSKAGLIPWNWVSWNTSKTRAEEMYNTNYVRSGLITGAQWDVMINTINAKTLASLSDSQWGNYDNISITYTGAAATYGTRDSYLSMFEGNGGTTNNSSETKVLLYTGSSIQCMNYNLYDVAGNLWEWTEENSNYATSGQYRVARGGGYIYESDNTPVCYRLGHYTADYTNHNVGFRVVLYIK